jgi:hypothetical protein
MSVGRGVGTAAPLVCPQSFDQNQGLCYTKCGDGFNGVGPVCWAKGPPGYVACGGGYAKDEASCAITIANQVTTAVTFTFSACGAGIPICKAAATGFTAVKMRDFGEFMKKQPPKDPIKFAEDAMKMMRDAQAPMSATIKNLSNIGSDGTTVVSALSKSADSASLWWKNTKTAHPEIVAMSAAYKGSKLSVDFPTDPADQIRAFADLTGFAMLIYGFYNPAADANELYQLLAASVDTVSAYSWPIYGAH